ncbi:MAG: response regulator transcription factor [Bacteroidia bacterium]|nr:response regulator transcription factor [Bacteroidia bacterium]
MTKKINLIIADDSQIWRNVLARELSSFDIKIAGEAPDGVVLLRLIKEKKPNIVILDLEMPEMDGNMAFNLIRDKFPAVKIVILSQYEDLSLMENYRKRGASAFFSKSYVAGNLNEFAGNLHAICDDEQFFPALAELSGPVYTEREEKIIPLICQGKTSKEIGDLMQLSEKTVERIRQTLFAKTESKNVVEFVRKSIKNGFEYLGSSEEE